MPTEVEMCYLQRETPLSLTKSKKVNTLIAVVMCYSLKVIPLFLTKRVNLNYTKE